MWIQAMALVTLAGGAALAGGCNTSEEPRAATDPSSVGLTVSAAANLSFAIREVAQRFEANTGIPLAVNLASSGQLTHQIEQGAPVDIFLSADVAHVEILERAGLTVDGSRAVYALGRLTLWVRSERDQPISDLRGLLAPSVERIALANPKHAPYGVAARHALQRAGHWQALQPKLVLGENVRQALQYAESGNVDVGLIPLSLAKRAGGRWQLMPADLHPPLEQALVILRRSEQIAAAQRLRRFLLDGAGREILAANGYDLPTRPETP